jgi:hypothetical protein
MGNATAGVTIMSCSKTMLHELYNPSLPLIVTATACSGYVGTRLGTDLVIDLRLGHLGLTWD